uniref:Secreted protein n=1 Tax=Trichogramma kaykai TaxID=54128 RepID=A0ABD2WIR9_9HYME
MKLLVVRFTFHSSLQRGAESTRAAKYHSSQLAYKSDIPTPASATRCTFAYMQRYDIIRQRAEFHASEENCIRRNMYYTCSRAKKRTQM